MPCATCADDQRFLMRPGSSLLFRDLHPCEVIVTMLADCLPTTPNPVRFKGIFLAAASPNKGIF